MAQQKSVTNFSTGQVHYDTLHKQAECRPLQCTKEMCYGSKVGMYGLAPPEIPKEDVLRKAKEFLFNYYKEINKLEVFQTRWREVEMSIESTSVYRLTKPELEFGAKLGWRNSSRCAGRIQWKNLSLFDMRDAQTIEEVFEAMCRHIEYSTNDGSIRPSITVFAERNPHNVRDKFRIWNRQVLNHAGYEMPDGSIVGDRSLVAFTKFCQRLGWKKEPGMFNILPMVISGQDGVPHFFEIPEKIIKKVKITHPTIPEFESLKLQWFALPAVSCCLFEVGGIQFPCAPFSGWYSLPEVGTRDLLDKQKYDMSEKIGELLKLDTTSNTTLWRDRVNLETNLAVLHSFNRDNVAIVDHHTQSEQFMDHFNREHHERGGCPTDWVWVVPPEGAGLTSVFHQEMLNYRLTPAYDYQEDLFETYRFPEDKRRVSLKSALKVLFFVGTLFRKQLAKRPKAIVYYGTETGTSKRYAETLVEILSYQYNAQVKNIKECTLEVLQNVKDSTVVFFISSTFGNGSCPTDAMNFFLEMKRQLAAGGVDHKPSDILSGMRYAVLALGASSYPNFCMFGKFLDQALGQLGGNRLLDIVHPDKTYSNWVEDIKHFLLLNVDSLLTKVDDTQKGQRRKTFRKISGNNNEFYRGLQMLEGKSPFYTKLTGRRSEGYSAILITLTVTSSVTTIPLQVGDHIAIFPKNHPDLVRRLLNKITGVLRVNRKLSRGAMTRKTSVSSVEDMLTSYYDIASAPSQSVLGKLAGYATVCKERERLLDLANNNSLYQKWQRNNTEGVIEVLTEFPSIEVSLSNMIDILDTMIPRWYGLASNPETSSVGNLQSFDLLLSVVQEETPKGAIRKGLCSNYLKDIAFGTTLTCFHRSIDFFSRPLASESPFVMVAAGSGIASYRAVCQEFSRRGAEHDCERNLLFFGCKDQGHNLLAEETKGVVQRFEVFSRVQKKYVQDVLEEQGALVTDRIVNQKGYFFVCGMIAMAQGVREALSRILLEHTGMTFEQVDEYIETMKLQYRYIEEIFGADSSIRQKSA